MPELAKKVLARLRQEQSEAPPTEPASPSSAEEVAALPLDAFAGRSLMLRVWAQILDAEIWFVSGEAQVRILQSRGIPREEIYTALELVDLLELFGRDPERASFVLEAKRLFGGSLRLEEAGT